ncbi:MAG TPA: hypothetical protein VJJ76_03770 [archaeon]|nr:hypothetical protein [archaeon]
MNKEMLQKGILIFAGAGLAFSGYLSYIELSGQGSSCGFVQQILVLPTCVYGFMMYAIIFALALAVVTMKK